MFYYSRSADQTNSPIATIQQGKVQGTFGKNLDGDIFLQFFGIPYAKPPVGELRFQVPQPIDPWQGVKDATKIGSASISRDLLTREIIGSEDCLYINVFTKNLSTQSSKLRPVMVHIHGGGLSMGSSRPGIYGPEFLMTRDIVLVTFNYRVGILGFLGFDDLTLGVAGNMGLKDQNLALKWVQSNIAQFNGDPNNVTIFGESAGAGSVHAHILSPASNGLFHKAIIQSGCALNSWFWGSKNNAREIVEKLGKSADSEKEALEILKKLPGMNIFSAQEKMVDSLYPAHRRYFAGVIETPSDTAFLSKSPVDILKDGSYNKVPVMMGYTETEGMLLDIEKEWFTDLTVKVPETELQFFIPYQVNVSRESSDFKQICELLKKLYSNKSNDRFFDEFTDACFLVGMVETLRYLLKSSENPIYFYRMSLAGPLNFLKRLMNKLDEPGACHADDLGYLFHSDITPGINPGSREEKLVKNYVELWTNFAEYGNPTPDDKLYVLWKPVETEENIELLDIGEKLVFKEIPEHNRVAIWSDILKNWPLVNFN